MINKEIFNKLNILGAKVFQVDTKDYAVMSINNETYIINDTEKIKIEIKNITAVETIDKYGLLAYVRNSRHFISLITGKELDFIEHQPYAKNLIKVRDKKYVLLTFITNKKLVNSKGDTLLGFSKEIEVANGLITRKVGTKDFEIYDKDLNKLFDFEVQAIIDLFGSYTFLFTENEILTFNNKAKKIVKIDKRYELGSPLVIKNKDIYTSSEFGTLLKLKPIDVYRKLLKNEEITYKNKKYINFEELCKDNDINFGMFFVREYRSTMERF